MASARLRVWRLLGSWLLGVLCGFGPRAVAAQADAPSSLVHVQVAHGACPSATLIEQKLRPLLGERAQLSVDAAPHVPAARGRVSVLDRGDRYTIEVDDLRRDLADPGRDCVERARVAAVFIALNLKAAKEPAATPARRAPVPRAPADPSAQPAASDPGPDSAPKPDPESDPDADPDPDPDPDPEPDPESDPEPDPEPVTPPPEPELGARFGVRLSAETAYTGELDRGAFGASAGAWLGTGAFRFDLGAAVLTAAEVQLTTRAGASGTVALTRIPFTLSASYLWTAGAWSLGPALGLGLDLLRLRGEGVERPQTELRLNPGGFVAADLHVRITSGFGLLLRVALHAYPRAYDLSVDPVGRLGRTPHLWLGANLGLAWTLP